MLRLLLAFAGLVAVAGGATVDARSAPAADSCPPLTATVNVPAAVVDVSQAHEHGVPLKGATIRRPGHFYELKQAVKIELKGNTIWATKGSILKLSCYARSKTGRKLPAVDLLRGSVTLSTVSGDPAGVITEEGLFDPRTDETIVFTVKRVLTKRAEPALLEKLKWFAGFGDQPMGTTTIASKSIVGVTPYVGPSPGNCRYVHGATLRTTRGFGHGTASYRP